MSAKKLAKGIRSLQHVVKLKCSAGILDPEAKGLKEFYRRVSTEKLLATNDKCELSLELHHRDEVPKIEMEIGTSAAAPLPLSPSGAAALPSRRSPLPPRSLPVPLRRAYLARPSQREAVQRSSKCLERRWAR